MIFNFCGGVIHIISSKSFCSMFVHLILTTFLFSHRLSHVGLTSPHVEVALSPLVNSHSDHKNRYDSNIHIHTFSESIPVQEIFHFCTSVKKEKPPEDEKYKNCISDRWSD